MGIAIATRQSIILNAFFTQSLMRNNKRGMLEMGKIEEHIGERWGRLVIIGTVRDDKRGRTKVVCRCDCGNVVEKDYTPIKKGKVQSCGCLLREVTEKRVAEGRIHEEERRKKAELYFLNQRAIQYIKRIKAEHKKNMEQMSYSLRHENKKLYYIWQSMLQRCTRPTHHKYPNYGGRGITVCIEWRTFEGFHKWATSNGYGEGLSLDRIDTNGNYEPNNCRWADQRTQQNNKRTNVWLERDGEIHTLAEWSRLLDINYDWLARNWQEEDFQRIEYHADGR